MSESRSLVEGEGALVGFCPLDGSRMITVKKEDYVAYSGGYYLYFLVCRKGHKWLRIITQYDESPPTLLRGWETGFE